MRTLLNIIYYIDTFVIAIILLFASIVICYASIADVLSTSISAEAVSTIIVSICIGVVGILFLLDGIFSVRCMNNSRKPIQSE